MLKLTALILFIFAFQDICAQHSYSTLKKEHQFNALEKALKKDPNNDLLLLKKLLLVEDRSFIYEDQSQAYTFNFELYDYEARLKDINHLLAQNKSYAIEDTLYQYLDLMYLRAQIHLSEAKDQAVAADYKNIIEYLQNNIDKYAPEILNNKLVSINDYFEEFVFYTEAEDSINFYKKQHLHILNTMLIIEKNSKFDIENPLILLELNTLGKTKANLLKDLGHTKEHIQYLHQLLHYTYEYVLIMKAEQLYDNIHLLEENQNNLLLYAHELAQAYYELKDYHNAQLWAEAYIKDMANISYKKDINYLLFYGIQDYSYKAYELLFNIAFEDKKQDLKLILKQLTPLIGNINTIIEYNPTTLEKQIQTLIEKHPKSGELYALYALFKCKHRQYHYHQYNTYGKEILALLDKAEKLSFISPYSNLMKGIVYIEFETNQELAAFYLEKALKDNPDDFYNCIEYIEDLQLNFTMPDYQDNIYNDLLSEREVYNMNLPQNIIQLLHKK